MHEDVRTLKIAMSDFHIPQISQTLIQVANDTRHFDLQKRMLVFDCLLQVSFITQLRYDVAIALAHERLIKFQNVRMVHLLKNADLLVNQLL